MVIALTVLLVVFIAVVCLLAITNNMDSIDALITSIVTFAGICVNIFITLSHAEKLKGMPEQTATQTIVKINGQFKAAVREAVSECMGLNVQTPPATMPGDSPQIAPPTYFANQRP